MGSEKNWEGVGGFDGLSFTSVEVLDIAEEQGRIRKIDVLMTRRCRTKLGSDRRQTRDHAGNGLHVKQSNGYWCAVFGRQRGRLSRELRAKQHRNTSLVGQEKHPRRF
jgi:hypothetical protein